ncbi:HAMP domain-containing histidine kinase [Gluconacetobacter tumulicola]|uniref:HAMP domain-containing histidine kinase n=1 Tax=Gluconacetobacter tumulicola TaxID=1017177 RepID=A0A7W4JCT0_9PROT|nr:HAMP domain-containing histidine kinase [Gluconacetobacter tumulicola]MBB2178884.1 HAMP domain-containing histidine kinase [Gluconacetobacter tumulicola]
MQGPDPISDDDRPDSSPTGAPAGAPSDSLPASGSRSKVLHDIRGLLSPALLSADRLSLHADPKVRELAEQIIRSIEQAAHRLKDLPPG